MFPTAQHVVPSSHTTFLPAECHNLLVQYFILLLWLFSVRLCFVTFIFFFWWLFGKGEGAGLHSSKLFYMSCTLTLALGGFRSEPANEGALCKFGGTKSGSRCSSKKLQEPLDPTSPVDAAPKELHRVKADSLLQTAPEIPLVPWDVGYINTGHLLHYNWTTPSFCVNQNLGFYYNSLADTVTVFSLAFKG